MGKGERLEKMIIDSSYKNVSRFSKAAGVPYTTIKSFIDRDLEKASIDSVIKIANLLHVSVEYLIGNDSKLKSNTSSTSTYKYVPVNIAAGLPENIDSVTEYEEIEIPDAVMGKWSGQSDIAIAKINGESMNKTIPNGSLIAVKPIALENLQDGDIVVYSDENDFSVKRMYKHDDHIIFRPHSSDVRFTDYIVSKNRNLRIYGKVVLYIVEMD